MEGRGHLDQLSALLVREGQRLEVAGVVEQPVGVLVTPGDERAAGLSAAAEAVHVSSALEPECLHHWRQ